jgi:hypothetical protein
MRPRQSPPPTTRADNPIATIAIMSLILSATSRRAESAFASQMPIPARSERPLRGSRIGGAGVADT